MTDYEVPAQYGGRDVSYGEIMGIGLAEIWFYDYGLCAICGNAVSIYGL